MSGNRIKSQKSSHCVANQSPEVIFVSPDVGNDQYGPTSEVPEQHFSNGIILVA
jgi:hypothetical protein